MDSTSEPRDALARYVPWIVAGVAVGVAIPVALARGAATAVLWLAFSMLASAVLLFWESLRTLVDPAASVDEDDDEDARLAAIEARKNAALRALKDIAFERSIGRLAEDDYQSLEARYRAEAREAMASVDEGVGPWREKAEALVAEAERRATGAPKPAEAAPDAKQPETAPATPATDAPARRECAKCSTPNDHDAAFCKKCGARLDEESADASA